MSADEEAVRRELAARDLGPVLPVLPALTAAVHGYFRAEVTGLDEVPDAPVLFVGNHSGGNGSPDSAVFALAHLDRFGPDRPLYWLGHELALRTPLLGDLLRRCGVLTARPEAALGALAAGADVVVYPGGDRELHRPWSARDEIRWYGRTGWARIARAAGVPVVPVVARGGHHTYLPLTDGSGIARRLGLDRRARLGVFPISLALPWGLNIGDFALHWPLPAKIRVAVLPAVDVARYPDDRAAYDDVVGRMQATLHRLAGRGPT